MARRRTKTKRRSRPKTVSLLNAMEAYAYANLLSTGLMGSTPWEALTGKSDIGYTQMSGSTAMTLVGAEKISLSEIVSSPDLALAAMQNNFMNNYQSMAFQAASISIGFRLGKRLLRKPLNSVNKNLIKPLGLGIRI